MRAIRDKWCMMLDINNKCAHRCTYCTKYIRHLRDDQIREMSLDEVDKALDTLEDWPNQIGLTGGDPLNHDDFEGLCKLIQKRVPKRKINIFTSSPKIKEYVGLVNETFGEVYINDHSKEQQAVCKHHPVTLALQDMVETPKMRRFLIENCWCNDIWSPMIGPKGCFFCDLALGLDNAFDLDGGWPVEKGWWRRDSYEDQIAKYCHLCGMCVPWETQVQANKRELMSPTIYTYFKEKMVRMDDVELVDHVMSDEEVIQKSIGWKPWRNREDKPAEGPAYVNH